ncbi:MAG: hypothetical protein HYS18_10905 [Burkholderiales bacterium]|nr:hypothetical protein [Burkholderiales bacterium]
MSNLLKHPQVKTKRPTTPHAAPRLPHERDESDDSQTSEPREEMKQAYDDIERGLVDTDLHGAVHAHEHMRASHENTQPTPADAGRNRDKERLKLPDGK